MRRTNYCAVPQIFLTLTDILTHLLSKSELSRTSAKFLKKLKLGNPLPLLLDRIMPATSPSSNMSMSSSAS